MLSLLSKIWLRYKKKKKTMITSLKLHQIYFPKEKTLPKIPKTAPAEAAVASTEAETAPAEAANSFYRSCNSSS